MVALPFHWISSHVGIYCLQTNIGSEQAKSFVRNSFLLLQQDHIFFSIIPWMYAHKSILLMKDLNVPTISVVLSVLITRSFTWPSTAYSFVLVYLCSRFQSCSFSVDFGYSTVCTSRAQKTFSVKYVLKELRSLNFLNEATQKNIQTHTKQPLWRQTEKHVKYICWWYSISV